MTPQDIKDLRQIINRFGGRVPLGQVLKQELDTWFLCPACKGNGEITETQVDYMALPGSYSYGKEFERRKECNVCSGVGKTPKELKPKMVQAGWE